MKEINMKSRNRMLFLALILMLSVLNYFRLKGIETIRLVEFLSIFTIGVISGLLIKEIISKITNKV